jgi:LPXTG-motif cell wall-anchored protein
MGLAMSNALALLRWHGFQSLNSGDTQDHIVWMLIGAAIAVVLMWVISRRRRRWF